MGIMNLICIGHGIKEVLSGGDSLACITRGASLAGVPVKESFIMSDGGDGFLEALQSCYPGNLVNVPCLDVFGGAESAPVLWAKEVGTVFIEVAKCLGLANVPLNQRDIITSGSAGLADLLFWAKTQGAHRVVVGLGGSATCDGGVGLLGRMQAWIESGGQPGEEVYRARDLGSGAEINVSLIREWLGAMELTVCVDVDSPLLGD